ncbi:MAG: hypothetical protein AAF696_26315 [Bacteroidota bacterium]
MKTRSILLFWVLFPCISICQDQTLVGLNLSPLLINTVDIQFERHVMPSIALQLGTGFRLQSRSGEDPVSPGFLSDYIALRNRGAYLSLGARFSTPDEWDYPYIAFEVVTSYFNENIVPPPPGPGLPSMPPRHVKDFKVGVNANIGFMLRVANKLYLDVGIEMGYTSPRPRHDVLAYYLPGMGISTFGLGRVGVEGGYFQPTLAVKYLLKRDKRIRIREMK